jgi:hypothetical protein
LPQRCIAAGTSERGCCPKCGAPWERILDRSTNLDQPKTIDWRSTCEHEAEPVPCIVLDPFAGAGTTGLVAARMNRESIGIDLNGSYIEMAERRISEAAPLWTEVTTEEVRTDDGRSSSED